MTFIIVAKIVFTALSRGCRPRIWPVLSPSLNQGSTVFVIETFHCLMEPGAIMGVGDRKRGVHAASSK